MTIYYLKNEDLDLEKLTGLLPSGAGFDTKPTIDFGEKKIKINWDWHLMEDSGMYNGYIPFTIYIYLDAKREGMWRLEFNTNRQGRKKIVQYDLRNYIEETLYEALGEGPKLIDKILSEEGKRSYVGKVMKEVKKKATPLMDGYLTDLEIDGQVIKEHPFRCPFVHLTRELGTHIIPLSPVEMYPKKHEVVPYLFGEADRYHILQDSKLNALEYHKRALTFLQINYFDGWNYKTISFSQAYRILKDYSDPMLAKFKAENHEKEELI